MKKIVLGIGIGLMAMATTSMAGSIGSGGAPKAYDGGTKISMDANSESNETLMKAGQWQDTETGLIWMRCVIGQKWESGSCKGESISFTLDDSLGYMKAFNQRIKFAGKSDWRLPTINELASLRKCPRGWVGENDEIIGDIFIPKGPIKKLNILGNNLPALCVESEGLKINTNIFGGMDINSAKFHSGTYKVGAGNGGMFTRVPVIKYSGVDFSNGKVFKGSFKSGATFTNLDNKSPKMYILAVRN